MVFCCDINGLIKNFVKVMNREGQAFKYLREKFPRLNDAKIKEGIFVGPQICQLVEGLSFGRERKGSLGSSQRSYSWNFREQKR